ncbi:hypothetical protein SAPIO_CDS9581 [Scedosporium apiospermum]|uniref:Uncharacterized protein n=1 Tax=Pseudallescheria apiosperma TaxID=563466 RepID=A0A084FX35_PSEDA|nr:uncharacterized protein SAPIO_CDS9581 [Scedosporium apiospermum]KEZ39647.1 hypothetical protein SAPIO_CDS9581 [Scedosporium apiospermum]
MSEVSLLVFVTTSLTSAVPAILSFLTTAKDSLSAFLTSSAIPATLSFLTAAGSFLTSSLSSLTAFLANAFPVVLSSLINAGRFLTTSIASAVPVILSFLTAAVSLLTGAVSFLAATLTTLTTLIVPAISTILLSIADLVSAILASIESVLTLILSPTVLVTPLRVLRATLCPVVDALSFVLAPLSYPVAGVALCATTIASFVLEFKLSTAAVVGLIAGAILSRLSHSISYQLGWLDEGEVVAYEPVPEESEAHTASQPLLLEHVHWSPPPTPRSRHFKRPVAMTAGRLKSRWANGNGSGGGNGEVY